MHTSITMLDLTGKWQVWVCLQHVFDTPSCPSPPDLACYTYDEAEEEFTYFGRNSELRLVAPSQQVWP